MANRWQSIRSVKKIRSPHLPQATRHYTVKVEHTGIDPKQLFQRFVVDGKETVDTQILFTYELSSYPTSLFDSSLLMGLPDKASLQAALIRKVPFCVISQYTDDVVYVLDGGALLQKLPWPSQQTYANLSNLYVQYVHRHYILCSADVHIVHKFNSFFNSTYFLLIPMQFQFLKS